MRWALDDSTRDWHLWFAWYPVRIGTTWVWGEWLQRRTTNVQGYRIHFLKFVEEGAPKA